MGKKIIWQAFIPKKISCFIWRLINKGLPTDDNFKRIGVPLPSRCLCCANDEESLNHLFFQGKWGMQVWNYMRNTFNKRCPFSVTSFVQDWLGCRGPMNYTDGVRIAAACFSVWEIWKCRNDLLFEGRSRNLMYQISLWLQSIGHLIRLSYVDNAYSRRIFSQFRISSPVIKGRWKPWMACSKGWTVSLAVISRKGKPHAAALISKDTGVMLCALSYAVSGSDGLTQLISGLSTIISFCKSRNLQPFVIQTSNIYLEDLLFGKDATLPWESSYACRKFKQDNAGVHILRVNAVHNNPAIHLAYLGLERSFWRIDELPKGVQTDLKVDRSGLPVFYHNFVSEL